MKTLKNIGPSLEAQLREVGITTPEELQKIGTKQAWLQIQQIDKSACINRLYALEGAIMGVHRYDLPEAVKEDLRGFYRKHKK